MSTAYVLRLGSGPYVWLKDEAPRIIWGPRERALTFESTIEARLAASRLGGFGPLTVEKIED
jgi:hypothetical protein